MVPAVCSWWGFSPNLIDPHNLGPFNNLGKQIRSLSEEEFSTISMGFGHFKAVVRESEAKTERQTDQDHGAYLPSCGVRPVTDSWAVSPSAVEPWFPHLPPRCFPRSIHFWFVPLVDSGLEHRPGLCFSYVTSQWGVLDPFRNKEKLFHEGFQKILLENKSSTTTASWVWLADRPSEFAKRYQFFQIIPDKDVAERCQLFERDARWPWLLPAVPPNLTLPECTATGLLSARPSVG